ncbi:hypothetical protein [Lutispora thermophila]|uniref:Uncharacterized protein n=1 Tax=Lutispora thermophila DSM 19022 TaxID=1122184 RepID=A0A1M6D3R8_9FIRM|nr:hypothetical protein [Lutispora thermophila]SHI67886.1 hypothetical protein SAMN02745176_00999 [Lutispora thermophila DSM 19022]
MNKVLYLVHEIERKETEINKIKRKHPHMEAGWTVIEEVVTKQRTI